MVGWHHRLNGQEFEQALVGGEGQESLACCRRRSCKELDTTERVNKNEVGDPHPARLLPRASRWAPQGWKCQASRIFLNFQLARPSVTDQHLDKLPSLVTMFSAELHSTSRGIS